jgi:diguanylate cyclase (GGDEF)-like protein
MDILDNTSLNFLGEFSDPQTEDSFILNEMQKSIRYLRPITVMFGLFYALTLLPDYFLAAGQSSFTYIAINKILFLILSIRFFSLIGSTKKYKKIVYWITACEFVFSISFLMTYYMYPSPDYLIQVMGLIVFVIGVCMIPNRLVFNLAVILFTDIWFVILAAVHFSEIIPAAEFHAGIVYLITISALCSIMSYRNNYYKRMQYKSNRSLEQLSTTDYLSKVYNRLKFEQLFKQWMDIASSGDIALSIVLFDIDDFKEVNDGYGHLAGDKVISEVASLVSASIRQEDILARWGGDEFILLLPSQSKTSAKNLAFRLCSQITGHSFSSATKKVTCSFGVAEKSQQDDLNSLVARADKMLYLAKASGKNTVQSE